MAYQRGSGFVGLQQYLNANQEAAGRMGRALVDRVNAEGRAAKGAIGQAAQAFETGGGVGQEFGDIANNPDAMRVVEQATRTLAAPGEMDTGTLSKQAGSAEQTARLAGSEEGRSVLLGKGRAAPVSQGGGMLDAFLAGRGGGAELSRAVGAYSKLRDYLGTTQKAAEGNVAGAKTKAKEALAKANDYLANAPPTMEAPESEVPYYLRPDAPAVHPRVGNEARIEEENRLKYRHGGRG